MTNQEGLTNRPEKSYSLNKRNREYDERLWQYSGQIQQRTTTSTSPPRQNSYALGTSAAVTISASCHSPIHQLPATGQTAKHISLCPLRQSVLTVEL